VVAAGEQRIETSPKNSVAVTPAKKCPTHKGQIVLDPLEQKIVCVAASAGKTHEFALFKSSRQALLPQIMHLGDYRLSRRRATSQLLDTVQKSKLHPLTSEQKQQNRALASCRVTIENVIRMLKRFRILSGTYRNRRKRFGLRLNLIATIANLHQ
jgi:inactivated superfamily I helicase